MRDRSREREFERLLDRVLDGLHSAEDVRQLNDCLSADDEARRHYVRYISLHAHLSWSRRPTLASDETLPPAPLQTPRIAPIGPVDFTTSSDQASVGRAEPTAYRQTNGVNYERPAPSSRRSSRSTGSRSHHGDVITLWEGALQLLRSRLSRSRRAAWIERVAAMLIFAVGAWALRAHLTREEPHSTNHHVAEVPGTESQGNYVARIVRITSNAEWDKSTSGIDYLFRLVSEEPIRITTGLMQLEFNSGAVVILEAPTVFVPLGPDSGRLESGKLTGKAANGNFRVLTASAEVIDLGTEFGVSVNGVTGTDVLVFNGEVKVVSVAKSGTGPNRVLAMTEGMAARIRPDGTTDYELPVVPESYSRSLSAGHDHDETQDMSLVDVICGGSGYDDYLAGAIDPLSGRPDSGVWRPSSSSRVIRCKGDGLFRSVVKRPPIDGVFIPPVDGKHVQLDSLGNTVDLPPCCAETSAPIWARSKATATEAADGGHDFWGTGTFPKVADELKTSQYGVVGLHPNVGLSIDLEAIRMQRHCAVVSFRSHVRNIDNYAERKKALPHKRLDDSKHSADFRVYVDGQLRYSRLAFGRADGDAEFSIPLIPTDQRLTLVSTEGEGEIFFDHVILVDPLFTF